MSSKNKIINDPIYGFITIQDPLIYQLIDHPYFQRLRRISQLGLTYLVYPGAYHTRFHHAIGAMHLMGRAIYTLRQKGHEITPEEERGVLIAILLHDVGHGPFSHALEHTLIPGVSHEALSLKIMEELNQEFDGALTLAIDIFTNNYPKAFLHQLISSQLDMDRLDYLRRDSFYSGVTEGSVNSERLLTMLNVKDDKLVVDSKGIYSIEKFLVARRLMYWQVYLHKTSLAAELLLVKALERFLELVNSGEEVLSPSHSFYPLIHRSSNQSLSDSVLLHYLTLEDSDILHLLKQWLGHADFVLRSLSKQILFRQLPKIKIQSEPFDTKILAHKGKRLQDRSISKNEIAYFVFSGSISNQTYSPDHTQILLKNKSGKPTPLAETIDYLDFNTFSKPLYRYYLCYPKRHFSL